METIAVNTLFEIVIVQILFLHYSLIAPCRLIIPDDEKAPETQEFAVNAYHASVYKNQSSFYYKGGTLLLQC